MLNNQERREYLIERAGIREYSGGLSKKEAEQRALKDWEKYQDNLDKYELAFSSAGS